MIEGQYGLNWANWKRLVKAVEDLGFQGLFRSDHFTNASGPLLDSLELWVSLTWLASLSKRLDFGPLVAPMSFRHPVIWALGGRDLDALSNGRFAVGFGARWRQREHEMFGFPLLEKTSCFDCFEVGVHVISFFSGA